MSNKVPRRDFLLAWLGGLLAGCLGRSQAHAAPKASLPPPPPLPSTSCTDGYGAVTTFVYDATGTPLYCIAPGSVTSYTYDGRNSP